MKGEEPYFSVIIPCYNRASFIAAAIDSVLAQTFDRFELIIVDDGSTDSTKSVVDRFRDARVTYYYKSNGERGAARNFGASKARGRYLNFLDSDDKLYDHHLMTAYSFISSLPFEPAFFHTGYELKDAAGRIAFRETGVSPAKVRARLIVTNYLGCDSVFVRSDIFAADPFQEDRALASSEDWELWLRLSSKYDLHTTGTVSLAMLNHNQRSLFMIPPDKIIERDNLLMELLFRNKHFIATYGSYQAIFTADRYTFYALVLVLANRKKESLQYLIKALGSTIKVLSRRRFWASLKHVMLRK